METARAESEREIDPLLLTVQLKPLNRCTVQRCQRMDEDNDNEPMTGGEEGEEEEGGEVVAPPSKQPTQQQPPLDMRDMEMDDMLGRLSGINVLVDVLREHTVQIRGLRADMTRQQKMIEKLGEEAQGNRNGLKDFQNTIESVLTGFRSELERTNADVVEVKETVEDFRKQVTTLSDQIADFPQIKAETMVGVSAAPPFPPLLPSGWTHRRGTPSPRSRSRPSLPNHHPPHRCIAAPKGRRGDGRDEDGDPQRRDGLVLEVVQRPIRGVGEQIGRFRGQIGGPS